MGKRVLWLDVVRGATVLAMVLANNADWHPSSPMEHSEWIGLRPVDVIFPFFLAISGTSLWLSTSRLRSPDGKQTVPLKAWTSAGRRTLLLFLIGSCMNAFGGYLLAGRTFPAEYRIMGVFQRIAVAYGISAVVLLSTPRFSHHVAVIAVLNTLYLSLLLGLDVPPPPGGCHGATPCCGRAVLTPMCSAEGYIDRAVLGQHPHIYTQYQDDEGILSSLTAASTVLLGVQFGRAVSAVPSVHLPGATLHLAAMFGTAGGSLAYLGLPIAKKLWTPSFVFVTFAIYLIVCGSTAFWIYSFYADTTDDDGLDASLVLRHLRYIGMNPLAVYIGSDVVRIVLGWSGLGIWQWCERAWQALLPHYYASFMMAFCFAAAWGVVARLMYQRRIFWKL